MKTMNKKIVSALAACCIGMILGTGVAEAAILAQWDFHGTTDAERRSPSTVAEGVSVTSLTSHGNVYNQAFIAVSTSNVHVNWGFGAYSPVTGARYNAPPYAGTYLRNFVYNSTGLRATVVAGANTTYNKFGITAANGNTMNLKKLTFVYSNVEDNRNHGMFLRYSLDGFATQKNIGYIEVNVTYQYGGRPTTVEFDLSGVSELQKLVGGKTVEFRLVHFKGSAADGHHWIMNPTLTGTVFPAASVVAIR